MSARPQGAGGSAPERRAEAAGSALLRNAPGAAHIAASAETARAQRLPATQTGEMDMLPPKAKWIAPGTFLDKSANMLGIFKSSRQASLLRDDASKRKSAVDAEHSELQSCMDEAEPVSGGSTGDPAQAAQGQQPAIQAAAPNAAGPSGARAVTLSLIHI